MKTIAFKNLLQQLDLLDTRQQRQLKEFIKRKDEEKSVALKLETEFSDLQCPYCANNKIWRWGKRNDLQRYKCKNCNKTFNSLTGSPLSLLNKKNQWINYIECLRQGLSIRKSAVKCKIHRNTAFRWRHRFLFHHQNVKAKELKGIIEFDEIYLPIRPAGVKNITSYALKGEISRTIKGKLNDCICIMIGHDRNGNKIDYISHEFSSKTIGSYFNNKISKDSLFCSNNILSYKIFTKSQGLRHGKLNIKAGQRINKDIVHLETISEYSKGFQDFIIQNFKGINSKYLSSYLGWWRFLNEASIKQDSKKLLVRSKKAYINDIQPIKVTIPKLE